MKKKILKAILATVVLTATSATIGIISNSSTAKAEMNFSSFPDGTGGVWNSQIVSYLKACGYSGITIYNISSTGNRYSWSTNHPNVYTITYVSNGEILDHEDFPMGN